jgi:hypothetical protein
MSTRPTHLAIAVQLDATHWQGYHNPAGTLTAIGSITNTPREAMESADSAYRIATAGKKVLSWETMGREDLH